MPETPDKKSMLDRSQNMGDILLVLNDQLMFSYSISKSGNKL